MPKNRTNYLRRQALEAMLLACLCTMFGHPSGIPAYAAQAPSRTSENREMSRRGVDVLMDGDPDAAIKLFRLVQQNDPQSPEGYLLEAQAIWWKIYYATADLLDPDVFDVARQETSPQDSHFSDLLKVAITRSEIRIRAQQDVARNDLYQGMAYALEARLAGLRGKDLATTRAGKKMRSLLLAALKLDPNLTDAYLGLGVYNYLIDTLPAPIRLLRILGNIPGGNREAGLQQIQRASEKGDLTREEARFFLAKDYSRESENKYQRALEMFQELARQYPHNTLWVLLTANVQFHLGEAREGDALYHAVFEKTKGTDSELNQAVHRAVREGLVRQHPNEKFDD